MNGMKDMKLVIKIPQAYYELVLERCKDTVLLNAFKNGIPLPKGHGRLFDADAFGKELYKYTEAPYQYALKVFNDAPTIIEADKE